MASAAETVVVPESADIWLHGMAVSTVFFRDTLAKLGLRFEKLAIAEYKNAFDELVRQEMSQPQREQLEALLESMFSSWVEDVAQSRHLSAEAVRAAVDEGVTSATRARELGLIDRVAYEDEVLEEKAVTLDEAAQSLPVTTPMSRKRVAVVSLLGGIIVGQSRRSPTPVPVVGGVMAGSETIIRCLRAAAEDDSTAAVVLHVDSGGGSALASDLIWREVARLRAKKPVVGVMEGVAASGGYYVLAGCNRIVAAPQTITGSIGVLTGKLVLEGAYEKLGANPQLLSRGKFGLLFNPAHGFSTEERALMERYGREVYERFVARVAEGRSLTRERVDEIGRGRVWTGRDALTVGLVDELGDVETAVDRACELGGLAAGAPTWNVRAPAQMLLPTRNDPTTWQRTLGVLLEERALLLAPPWALGFSATA
ncbi:MAG: signal peptide peptidase SppA [Polyangiaceae bacterium]